MFAWVDEISGAHFFGQFPFVGIHINSDDALGFGFFQTLDNSQSDCSKSEDCSHCAFFDFCRVFDSPEAGRHAATEQSNFIQWRLFIDVD